MRLFACLVFVFIEFFPIANAQTLDDLKNDGKNTDNVLTYGIGYSQQRYSSLNQINKRTVRRLVPVWILRKRSFNPVPCIICAIVMDAASARPQGQDAGNAIRQGSNTS